VALVADRADDPITRRLRAELGALGFEVVAGRRERDAPSRASLESIARSSGAVAAIRVVPSPEGVEVWIADRVTGKTVLREVVAGGAGDAEPAVVAVRAVELLRASLLEIEAPHPPRGEEPAGPQVRALVAPAARAAADRVAPARLTFGIGPAVTASPGGLGGSTSVLATLRWWPADRIGVGSFVMFPAGTIRVDGPEGEALVSATVIGAGARWALADRSDTWLPELGAGVSIVTTRMDGLGYTPYIGASDRVTVAAPYLDGGLGIALSPGLRLRVEALGGVATPRPVVRFAGREAATWGRPFAVGALCLEGALW
jgi:hypothetical protein